MTDHPQEGGRIGLALSGGGIRAAVFHLGVLRRLATAGMLEQVTQISTVSGGSLVTGAIFARADGRWPSSQQYVESVLPRMKETLTSGDLFSFRVLGLSGLARESWRIAIRRANVLASLLRSQWGIKLKLSDLPISPVWHINTTCYETGKNWRFTRDSMGDWQFGRHYSPDIDLAEAMAASAAVPYVIGALKLDLPAEGWWETDPASKQPLRKKERPFPSVRLWDGGAYENMALEQLYKPMTGLENCDILICSDASGPLGKPASILKSLSEGSLASPRLFDIASDQIRALRTRTLLKSILQKEIDGFLFRIGTSARQFAGIPGSIPGLSDEDCARCLNYPTSLTRIATNDFDLLVRHGSEVADMTIAAHGNGRFGPCD